MATEKGYKFYSKEEIDESFGERIFQKWGQEQITLPVGNYAHRFALRCNFSSASSNGAIRLDAPNYPFTGTCWIRRITNNNTSSSAVSGEDSTTDSDRFLYLAMGADAGTSSGGLYVSGEIIVSGTTVRARAVWHCSGFRSSGLSTMEGTLSSTDQEITIAPVRANGTVSNFSGFVESIKLD